MFAFNSCACVHVGAVRGKLLLDDSAKVGADPPGFDEKCVNLRKKRLELEITETLIIDDFEGTREPLGQLRSQGISIALDDFGTGYSSLTHLRQLLFDRIKIDKSFVAELTTRAESAAIVSAVIALGNSLGVGVTAEGVETRINWTSCAPRAVLRCRDTIWLARCPWKR
jgi:predicted signal transduction protein with EAL and GGDEF domain